MATDHNAKLMKKKESAIAALDKASKVYVDETTVKDTKYNESFIRQTE